MLEVHGPIQTRKFLLENVCESNVGHKHNYDHAMIVIRGRIQVLYRTQEGGPVHQSKSFEQGEIVTVKAEVFHEVKALESNTQYICVFSHRDFDGLVTQTYNGNLQASL